MRDDAAGADYGREPMLTPARMIAPPPTHTSDPISDWLPEFLPAPLLRVQRMQWRVYLNCRPEEGEIANPDGANVQHDAIEIKEHSLAEFNVRAIVAEEGRLHPHGVATLAEQIAQDATTTSRRFILACGVELLAKIA